MGLNTESRSMERHTIALDAVGILHNHDALCGAGFAAHCLCTLGNALGPLRSDGKRRIKFGGLALTVG